MSDQKPSKKKYFLWAVVIIAVIFLFLRPTDEGKISAALYNQVAKSIVEQGGDPQFEVAYIEVNGNNAEISYYLSGGKYKATATKTENGTWIISK